MRKLLFALSGVFVLTTSYVVKKENVAVKTPNTFATISTTKDSFAIKTEVEKISSTRSLYNTIDFSSGTTLKFDVFEKALLGFNNLKKAGKIDESTKLLTVCDFSLSSNIKRLWVINVESGEIVFNSLVAHGKNTGEEFATDFSNIESSYQSSLGFYITDATYNGGNGYSLKLHGMDPGYNDAAFKRAIVMHGANYVSEEFAKQHKRIGRSWGCPAVPQNLAAPIIDTIKGKNVLFIYHPDEKYLKSSQWLKS